MKKITIEDAYNIKNVIYIDVRSPAEYKESTIPGAINLPLFSDEERKEIGISYHQNKNEAYEKGFLIGTSKLFDIYKYIKSLNISDDYSIIIFCWRGGMRSKSIAINLSMMGINAFQLAGGYKAYRKSVLIGLNTFKNYFKYINIHGNTGVGKTILLKELEKKGQPILDLEGLANNRGSMFGGIGLGNSINQKMFDSYLLDKMRYNKKKYFFVESESRRIGNIILPDFLLESMEKGKHILIQANIEQRIKNIMEDYLPIDNKDNIVELISSNKFFKKRKGIKWVLDLLEKDDYYNFIKKLLIDYYDPLYYYSEKKYNPYDLIINNKNFQKSIDKLISIIYN